MNDFIKKEDALKKKKERRALRMLVLITQLGICMLVPVFICVFAGQYLSQRLGITLIFPLFLLLGILAGFKSVYQTIKRFVRLK